MSKQYTVIGQCWWGDGDYRIQHVVAENKMGAFDAAQAQVRADLLLENADTEAFYQGEQFEDREWPMELIAIYDGHLQPA